MLEDKQLLIIINVHWEDQAVSCDMKAGKQGTMKIEGETQHELDRILHWLWPGWVPGHGTRWDLEGGACTLKTGCSPGRHLMVATAMSSPSRFYPKNSGI
ncbi:uncharacterized protein LOC106145117 isoform X2 [Ictidomys tridecemlineatus]